MAKPLCSSESNTYSSPVPYVGLYIAGATLVCLLLMLCDMIYGFRRRALYLPCKLFSINSVTLFLLATASKLPVDLTTYMPSASDQLSKLSSTAMVCVCIGFLVPSFGINRETESITNLIALSLMVVTIVVNVCIQMCTGVIFSFIVEHIIILCCMISLLLLLWSFTSGINCDKKIMVDTNRNLFKKSDAKSFLHQVRLWYMCSCITNPQYLFCGLTCLNVAVICMVCLGALSYAAFRSLVLHKLEFCKDVSDYEWSILVIVVTQIITVVVGSLGIVFRFTTILRMVFSNTDILQYRPALGIMEIEMAALNFLSKMRGLVKVVSIIMLSRLLLKMLVSISAMLLSIIYPGVFVILSLVPLLVGMVVGAITFLLLHVCCPTCLTSTSDLSQITSQWKEELKDHVSSVMEEFPEKITLVCVEDMKKWMDASNTSPSPNHLVQLLTTPRSQYPPQNLVGMVQQIGIRAFSEGYRLSCLSFVILERIVSVSMPSALAESIAQAFNEAFELIYYIDEKINVGNSEDQRKHQLAKVLLEYKDVHLSKNGSTSTTSNWSVSEAISSIKKERRLFFEGLIAREMDVIIEFILMREMEYTSIEELYFYLEQLFVDMLHFFLSQLPIAILKEVNESPIEVHEEKARLVLKLLCKLKLLEDKVQWSFPEGYRVTRLMDPEGEDNHLARNTENQNLASVDDQDGGATTIQEVPDVEIGSQG